MGKNTQQGAASAGAPFVAVDLKGPVWDVDGTLYRPGRGVLVPAALAEALSGKVAKVEPAAGGDDAGALPEDFPSHALLMEAGFDSVAKVQAASDEDLIAIDGVGPAALKKIRAAQ